MTNEERVGVAKVLIAKKDFPCHECPLCDLNTESGNWECGGSNCRENLIRFIKDGECKTPFEQVLNEMLTTHKAKNADYGNSFEKLLESIEDNGYPAELALFIRASDKINRLITLAKQEQRVKGENIRDTVLDLANYSAMFVAWLDKREGRNNESE